MTAIRSNPEISNPPQLDPNIRMRDIINTLPPEIFIKNPRVAWTKLIINVLLVGLGYWALAVAPWYLLPPIWIFLGTALTGFFVIGHDCGHRSFSNRKWVNNWVGHLMFLPLLYPFHGWRIKHDRHHKHTNNLEIDNAWTPFTPEGYEALTKQTQWVYRFVRGRFWWLGSIGHCATNHFDWRELEGTQREQFKFSALFTLITGTIGLSLLIATTGPWGFLKFWALPWLVYHFWMSTFTIVHHTIPSIPFKHTAEWNEASAQLAGTVHCDYPAWVEFLCHDINVHVPHHISTAIPWYNLRQAHRSLKENWGEHLVELKFSWSLMKEITDRCHLHDDRTYYQSFADYRQTNQS